MNIDNEIIQIGKKVDAIMEAGYTRQEAIQLIQAAALVKLTGCVGTAHNGKVYLRIIGNIATYEQ